MIRSKRGSSPTQRRDPVAAMRAASFWVYGVIKGVIREGAEVIDGRQAARHPTTALVLDEEDGMTVFVLAPGDILRDSGLPQVDGR